MATVRKTITVTDQQNAWMHAQLEAGAYANESELVRDLIRREQERLTKTDALRETLKRGEDSGLGSGDPERIRKAVKIDWRSRRAGI